VERGDGRGGGRREETGEDALLKAEHGAGGGDGAGGKPEISSWKSEKRSL
jgi:hypothetical protein